MCSGFLNLVAKLTFKFIIFIFYRFVFDIGIEAEAVMLGQAITMVIPEVIGYRLIGKLPQHVTSTDLVLAVTKVCFKVTIFFYHLFIYFLNIDVFSNFFSEFT